MTVNVCWLSYRQPDIIPKGSWDVHQLELVTDRRWGTPPDPLDYSHHLGFEQLPAGADGAVVIIGAQHHYEPQYVERLNADLARLRWVVLVLAGDEHSLFPWQDVQHPNMALWIMTPRPQLHADSGAFFIGEGYHAETPGVLAGVRKYGLVQERTLDWSFAGQVTHARRLAMTNKLRSMPRGHLKETAGFLQGDPHRVYLARLAASKVAPCPSGPGTPDSFRFYEALEAGCVPLADACTPEGWPGYWQFVYGPNLPFPLVEDWNDLPAIMDDVLADWPRMAKDCGDWWNEQKARIVQRLDDDVRMVGGG